MGVKLIRDNWVIVAILAASLILRLWRIDELTTFGGDFGYDIQKIKGILEGHFTLLGPPIGRFADSTLYLGPLYYYLQAPFLFLSGLDPIGPAASIILVRLAVTFLVYLATKKLFGLKTAIFAAAIAALSPYWVDSLGPPSPVYFAVLISALVIFLVTFVKKKSFWYLVLLGFLAGVNVNFHYLGLVLLPALVAYVILTPPFAKGGGKDLKITSRFARRILMGISSLVFGFLIALAPLILFELRHQFFITSQLLNQLTVSQTSNTSFLENAQLSIMFLETYTIGFSLQGLILLIVLIIVAKDTALRFFVRPFAKGETQNDSIRAFLIAIVVLNLLGAVLYFGRTQPHYLAASYPVVFIFTAAAISKTQRLHRFFPYLAIALVALSLFSKNDLTRTSGYTMPEDLSLPVARNIAMIIASDAGGDSFNITSTLDGDSRALPYRYLIQLYGKIPLGLEHYNKGDSLYVITRDPARAILLDPLFEIASFQPSNIAGDWSITGDIHLIKLSKKEKGQESVPKFITIINPVRPRSLWVDPSINSLEEQLNAVKNKNLPATWLLQYETLFDQEIISTLKDQKDQELGAFLEVSEKWATEAGVSYKVAQGDYYRPDKVFLSGYSPADRIKLVDTYFSQYRKIFGKSPQTVGAWYIDAPTQEYLGKLGVTTALTLSDQFNTDAASIWGKYFAMPFYPSRRSSLEPAKNQSDKIPLVNLQWAQRDPVDSYGKDIKDSRQSFQANDYINNGFDFSYFKNLMSTYLDNQKTDFLEVTIGLEAGQEAVLFAPEFARQLDTISRVVDEDQVKAVTASQFSVWYQNKYPGISPAHFVEKDQSFWFMSQKFRAAIFKEGENFLLKDLRYYQGMPFRDYFYADGDQFLDRKVNAVVDNVLYGNQINLGQSKTISIEEHFDRLRILLDNNIVLINTNGVEIDGQKVLSLDQPVLDNRFMVVSMLNRLKEPIENFLALFKYSHIAGEKVFGIAISSTDLIGVSGIKPGIYSFEQQTFLKFLSPKNLLGRWQPWIN